jgi:hypothetical protein
VVRDPPDRTIARSEGPKARLPKCAGGSLQLPSAFWSLIRTPGRHRQHGLRIAGTTTTTARLWTDRPGSKAAIPRSVLCAAVPGTTILRVSARPPASGAPPTAGPTALASGLGGRLPLNSLQLYIFTSWVQGEALVATESRGERVYCDGQFKTWLRLLSVVGLCFAFFAAIRLAASLRFGFSSLACEMTFSSLS